MKTFEMNGLRSALITGAANGIGKAIATKLALEGCFVYLVDLDDSSGEKLQDAIGLKRSRYIHCDLTASREVEELFTAIIEWSGKVDVLVNNAGVIRDNMIHKMSEDDFDTVLDVNLKAVWRTCKHAAKIMREQGSGKIVNISSRAWLGNMGQTNYAASKAGVIGLSRTLALELGKYNVLVNVVAPGLIDTPMSQKLPQEIKERLINAQPIKHMGLPVDIARAVAFFVSDENKFITGQTLYVDGGKSIGAGI